tara:strand:- start:16978 stop:17241 length:264 start_codon:yes stop_codon:yes gene_type:complete
MKNLLMIIGLSMLMLSCGVADKTPTNSVTVKMLRTHGIVETETFNIPKGNFVTIKRRNGKSWLVHKFENGKPTILRNRVTHILNLEY